MVRCQLTQKKLELSLCKSVKVWNHSTMSPHLKMMVLVVRVDPTLFWKLELNMKVIGTKRARKMAVEFRSGLMDLFMKVTGKTIRQTEEVASFTPMVMYTLVSGKTTKLTAMVATTIQTVLVMKDTGLRISSTVRVLKNGLMVHATKVITKTVRNTEEASSCGLTDPLMMVISLTITFTERDCTLGPMVEDMTDNGTITRCTDMVYLSGLMAESTKEITTMIKRKVMVSLNGLMVAAMMASGKTANNMVKASTPTKKVILDKANGLRASAKRLKLNSEVAC
mmetsp:Transcript_41115/g.55862  ORF Transcript_41115/g.55862 Transcript_41115/m.55862 type:complete len:281 (-) Transcript_41115:48-890(-)